jgi:hypothetical protein
MAGSLLLFFVTFFSFPAEKIYRVEVADLTMGFKVFVDGKYLSKPETEAKHKCLYFYLDGEHARGNYLEVESNKPFSLFVNGMLARHCKTGKTSFSIDSLSGEFTNSLSFSIYRENASEPVLAKVVNYTSVLPTIFDRGKRQSKTFSDFSILASGILLVGFVFLLRVNARITFDYFNVVKLFSVQEREENLTGTKISASFNLLIYLFGCLLTSLLLFNLYYKSGETLILVGDLTNHTLYGITILWIIVSLILFTGLFTKLILLHTFSFLFNLRDLLTIQFFNFMRLLFFACLLIMIFLIGYFIFEVQDSASYARLIDLLIIAMLMWLPLIFFKLLGRAPNKMFHLFSYLCTSEIFPVLFLIKVLFF